MRTGEKRVTIPTIFSNGNIKPWVVFVDSIVVTLETAPTLEPTVALGTRNHWDSERIPWLATVFVAVSG